MNPTDEEVSSTNIRTTDMEHFFSTTDEEVLDFIKLYNNPDVLSVMRQLFYGAKTKEELLKACQLTEEQFNAAINPLVEARLLEWDVSEKKRGKVLKGKGHGINNFITLLLVAFTTTWARRPGSN